jgi:hypothetical protein
MMITRISFVLAWTALVASVAHSAEIEAQFSAGLGRSDNIARTSDNEIEETIGVAGLSFGLTEETSRLFANIRSQFDYLYYADGTFDDEWVGGLEGTLDFTLIDERLTWMVRNNFGQQTIDPLSAANPGNREDVNFFTTGPNLSLLTGSRNFVDIDLRYSSVSFEERDTDNERTSAALRIGRDIRRSATLSLNATTERVEFDNDGASPDFDRHEGFVRYEVAGGRNVVGIDLGYTEIDVDGETSDGVLARIDWSREVSPSTTIGISGGTSFSDQSDIFRFNQDTTSDLRDTGDDVSSAEPFTSNFFRLSHSLDRDRLSVSIALSWRQEDYKSGPPIDRNVTEATLDVRRDIARSVFAGFSFRYQRRDFKYLEIVDDNTTYSAELGYRFGPSSSASLRYQLLERSGDNAVEESRENSLFLRFFYTPAWGR